MTTVYDDARMRLYPGRVLALRGGRTPPPVQVLVSPCDTCNHRCGFCTYRDPSSPVSELFVTERGSPPVRRMGDDVLMRLPGELAAMGVEAVQVTGGGEPMLHPLFGDFCWDVLDQGMALAVVTNGTRCRPEWLDALRRCVWLRVSINAGTEAAYRDAHRCGRGEWEKAWAFVRALAGRGPTLGVSMVATAATAATAALLAEAARDAGASYARITVDYHAPEAWPLLEAQREALADLVTPSFGVLLRPPAPMRRPAQKACYYQAVAPYVGGDGVLYRCCNTAYTAAGRLGDLNAESFAAAWARLNVAGFDARGCPECAFGAKNAEVARLVEGPRGHDMFP